MASILDNMHRDVSQLKGALAISGQITARILPRVEMTPRAQSIAELLGEGLSMADILDITPEERDAMLASGIKSVQLGDFAAAKDVLSGLVRLEPLDRRAVYALGVAQQGAGDPVEAGRTYLYALALDALQPDTYLRLGECLLANGERDAARGCFEAAKVHARNGGSAAALAHADRMIAALDAAESAPA